MITVLADGCFDIIHAGHVRYLQAARKLGGRLVVSLAMDERVAELKGEGKPVNNWHDRAIVLREFSCVDDVIPSMSAEKAIMAVRPQIYCKGEDSRGTVMFADDIAACKEVFAEWVLIPVWHGAHGKLSSSKMMKAA